jgi:D-arabinose 1-dehydrogenase-like Zn-dependent alcohol dehydrogenase
MFVPRPDLSRGFARHPQGECHFCDAGALQLCAAYQLFAYSGGCEDHWKVLRGFVVPGTRGIMGRTVWQCVTDDAGITDLRGGKYSDGGEIPTPEQVALAILLASTA